MPNEQAQFTAKINLLLTSNFKKKTLGETKKKAEIDQHYLLETLGTFKEKLKKLNQIWKKFW